MESLASPDFLEGSGLLEDVVPPVRASNPQIHDKEFIKMDKSRGLRTITIPFNNNQRIFSSCQQQEP